jgi:hypothetical protein
MRAILTLAVAIARWLGSDHRQQFYYYWDQRHNLPKLRVMAVALLTLAIIAGVHVAVSAMDHVGIGKLSSYQPPVKSGTENLNWGVTLSDVSVDSSSAHKGNHARLAYDDLPLSFEENSGHAGRDAKFLAKGRGFQLDLLPNEADLHLTVPQQAARDDRRQRGPKYHLEAAETEVSTRQESLRLNLLGARSSPKMLGIGELPGKTSYFIGKDPRQWRLNVSTFGRVLYQGVYPGIDLVYYGNNRQLEYDFMVQPGATPAVIRIQEGGARNMELDSEGNLLLSTSAGAVRLKKPVVYQVLNNDRVYVTGSFKIINGNTIGIAVAGYDRSKPLVIDPTLNYATFVGESVDDKVNGIALGTDGSTYVAGVTSTANSSGAQESFVAHLAADGKTLRYIAYLGGSAATSANAIAVDVAGNAYIAGETKAVDFPLQNPLQAACSLNAQNQCLGDAFLTKLAQDGSLAFSTYLGGSLEDSANGIALDGAGNIYIAGSTASTDFPVIGAAQGSTGGSGDAFAAKISADDAHVVYATYLGGTGADQALAIAVDQSNSAYITGSTTSTDFPTTAPFQANCKLNGSNQ